MTATFIDPQQTDDIIDPPRSSRRDKPARILLYKEATLQEIAA